MPSQFSRKRQLDEAIETMFNVHDSNTVSKGQLMAAVQKQHNVIQRLSMELFCADPTHEVFSKNTEGQMVPYRKERMCRKAEGGK